MDRAGQLLSRLPLPGDCLSSEEFARAVWPQSVGKRIAARTRAVQLRDSTLVVEVEDAVWKSQLWTLRGQILSNLKGVLGQGIVTALEFHVRIPRRAPQVAQHAQPAPEDEADQIADPVLRRLYRSARRKSSA